MRFILRHLLNILHTHHISAEKLHRVCVCVCSTGAHPRAERKEVAFPTKHCSRANMAPRRTLEHLETSLTTSHDELQMSALCHDPALSEHNNAITCYTHTHHLLRSAQCLLNYYCHWTTCWSLNCSFQGKVAETCSRNCFKFPH